MNSYTSPSTKPLYKATQIVYYLLGIVEIILTFRFFLLLFGANPAAGFTVFVYQISYPLAAPFLRVFQITEVNGSVFEWTTLLAMFVYWIAAVIVVQLLLIGKSVSTHEAAARLEQE